MRLRVPLKTPPSAAQPARNTLSPVLRTNTVGRYAQAARSRPSKPPQPVPADNDRGTTRTASAHKVPRGRRLANSLSPQTSRKPHTPLSPVPHRRRSGCAWGAAGWVCAGCVGWVWRVGCVAGVSRVCRLGVLRECRRRVPGVSRACGGCAAGVSGVCRRGVRAAGWKQWAPGPATPPPPPARWLLLRVSSTRVCAPACRSRQTGLRLPLFFFFRLWPSPGTSSFPRPIFASPGSRAAVPSGPLPLFPGDSKTRKTDARLKETQDTRASGFRRARRTSCLFAWDCFLFFPGESNTHARQLLFAVAVLPTAPHRTAAHATPTSQIHKFHPPAKNTPPPLGDPTHGPEWLPGVHLGVCAFGRRPPR